MFNLVTDAHAQAGAAAPGGFFSGPLAFPVMMGLMFAILYFMVIRPQSAEGSVPGRDLTRMKERSLRSRGANSVALEYVV